MKLAPCYLVHDRFPVPHKWVGTGDGRSCSHCLQTQQQILQAERDKHAARMAELYRIVGAASCS